MFTNKRNYRILFRGGFLCLVLAIIALRLTSCNSEDSNLSPIESYYNESKSLPDCQMDSIKSFAAKFCSYVKANSEVRQHELYRPTVNNIGIAALHYGYNFVETNTGFTINTEWDGETEINF